MNKVLLTGASGFIGSHIAELFLKERIPTKCFVRLSSDISFLKQLKVELVYGDVTDIKSIQSALSDVDIVIHTAAKSSDWGKYQDYYNTNVNGTMNILKACYKMNVDNVIITGSISSYGEEDSKIVKDESFPFNSHYPYFFDRLFPSAMNYYRDTKAILTQKACAFAIINNMNLTIIEPAWVYGEREFNTGFYEYIKSVRDGMIYAPGCKRNSFHIVYAGDLAKAYLLAYKKKLHGVNRIIIGNPKANMLNEIHTQFCKSANLTPPKLIPKFIVYPIGFFMELIATMLGKRHPPLLTRSRVNLMYDGFQFSVEKAKRLLEFETKTPLHEGINKTVIWYKQNGFL